MAKKFRSFMELKNRFCVYKSPALWTLNKARYISIPHTQNFQFYVA